MRRERRRHRSVAAILAVTVVGTRLGLGLSFAAGAPAKTAVVLNRPEALAVTPDGGLLIANQGTNQILLRESDGNLKVIAGTGRAGHAGDGGPALHAELNDPWGMAVAANGTIYVADTGNNRVRTISPSGVMRTVAGNGQRGVSGVGGPAVAAEVSDPYSVALGSQGQLYIADVNGLQLVSPNGVLNTIISSGPGRTLTINGVTITFRPTAVAVGSSGDLYVNDLSPKLIVELTPTGQVVNSWPASVTAAGLAAAPDGSVLVGNYGFAVDRIANGQFTTLVTFALNSLPGLTGTFRPSGIAVGKAGQIYEATDGVDGGTVQPVLVSIDSSDHLRLLATGLRVKP